MRVALLACAWASACTLHTLPAPRESRLELHTEVGYPYHLVSMVAVVDGDVVARGSGTLRLSLRPGTHELAVAALVSRPCDLSGEEREQTRVRAAHRLEVGAAPVASEARVVAGAVTGPELEASVDGTPFDASVAQRGCCGLAEFLEPLPSVPRCASPTDGVLVTGEVQHPREVAWKKGMTVYDAITSAGGATRLANLRYTQVRRPCGEVLDVPWYASVTALELQPGDDVVVRMTPDP